jgi:hypothetical protein
LIADQISGIEGTLLRPLGFRPPPSPAFSGKTALNSLDSFPPVMHIRTREPALEILMNSTHYYHTQPKPISTRALCPVCNQPAYSLAGIHPQCAERQAEPPRPKGKAKEAAALVADGTAGEAGTAVETPAAVKRSPYGRGRRPLTTK